MAYKFQLGAATLSGSSTYKGEVEAVSSNITAVQVSSSGFANATGESLNVAAAGDITFKFETGVFYSQNAPATQELKLQMDVDPGNNVQAIDVFRSGSGTDKIIEMANDTANDFYLQLNNNSSVAGWRFNQGPNHIGGVSGSSNLTCNGSATFGGNVTIAGDLVVSGDTVSLSSSAVTVKDLLVQVDSIATNDAQSQGSGFLFGQASQAYGGLLQYASGATEGRHIAFKNSDDTGAALKVGSLFGDGSQLSGISSSPSYEVNEISASSGGDTPTALQERTNIITNSPTSGIQEVLLVTTASAVAGKVIRIKLQGTATEENHVVIKPSGNDASDKVSIDGEPELLLMSPSASVDLIYLGLVGATGSYAIF